MSPVKMSEAENEVMKIVWASESPVTSNEILDKLNLDRRMKKTTVLTFLSRLSQKGLLVSARIGRTNIYTPKISENDYRKLESKKFLADMHGGSIKSFVAALCDDKDISGNEIEELKKWLLQR